MYLTLAYEVFGGFSPEKFESLEDAIQDASKYSKASGAMNPVHIIVVDLEKSTGSLDSYLGIYFNGVPSLH